VTQLLEPVALPRPRRDRRFPFAARRWLSHGERRNPSPGVDSRNRRDHLARTSELARTLRIGSLIVAWVLGLTGFVLALRFPEHAVLLVAAWTSTGAASLCLYFLASRTSPRFVMPMTVFFTILPAVGLVATAFEPRALLPVTSGFTILPVAVPLFLAWTRALRTSWFAAYTMVIGGIIVVTGFGYLDTVQRMDLTVDVVFGSFIGWVGGELLERLRDRNLEQESELLRLNRKLSVRATTDALTGLANRRQLDSDLQILSTSRSTDNGSYAFIMLDLDQFKRLNDEFGHAVGDAALRSVSLEMRRVVREGDTVYRYGGEEFLVIMPNASRGDATVVAERIRLAIANLRISAVTDNGATGLTISGGVAFSTLARERWETVLAAADAALYEAKASGRNRICMVAAPLGDRPVRPADRHGPDWPRPVLHPSP